MQLKNCSVRWHVQDDSRVVTAKQEVQRLVESVKKQQQQFADLPDQLNLDPNIPLTFTRASALVTYICFDVIKTGSAL